MDDQKKVLVIADSVTVGELAEVLHLPVTALVGELFKNGIVATINQRLDFETAQIMVEELGLEVELQKKPTDTESKHKVHQLSDKAVARPPIVAVMGHVDHGKTSLLDSIMGQTVAAGEAGGITQHISAYQTVHNGRTITLLDTPGHEAFAALRQHGATLTDVVIIVVAADDGVKPQTIEAIRFARTANAKIVVALNKIDKDTANPGMVMGQLAENGVVADQQGWGGDVPMVEVSAKTGQGIETLLETVLLVADLEDLKADEDVPAEGLVIEARVETGRGPVVRLLVEQGMLKPGHFMVAGTTYGKVRTLQDFRGKAIKSAGPSTPVIVTGFKEVPQFGDQFTLVKNERLARQEAAGNRAEQEKRMAVANVTGADMLAMINQEQTTREFNVIVKADVRGSLTSVVDSLKLIDTGGEVRLRVIASGVGNISESDIRMAADAKTVIYGFNVDLPPAVKRLAARDKVEVQIYSIIYELIDDVRARLEALLAPEVVETEVGKLKVKGVFRTMKEQIIAGGEVTKGKVEVGVLARVMRGGEQIAQVEVEKVQRQQQEAKEVFEGEMCGLSLKTEKKLLIEEGDMLEFFTRELVKRTLK
jgi:translation initiation factor IF-2